MIERTEGVEPPNRRDFLRGGAAAAGAAAFSGIHPTIAAALNINAASVTGTISDVQYVVVLMLENRSFDHLFGTKRGVRGYGDRYTIPQPNGRAIWQQTGSDGNTFTPFHLDTTKMRGFLAQSCNHDLKDAQSAWDQGRYGKWGAFKDPKSAPGLSMGFLRKSDLPFHYALADAFTLCDAYHCSVAGATLPNRVVLFSGTNAKPGANRTDDCSEPRNLRMPTSLSVDSGGKISYTFNPKYAPLDWPTIPEILEQNRISWKIYQNPTTGSTFDGIMHGCLPFKNFRMAQPGSPLYEKGLRRADLDQLRRDVGNSDKGDLAQVIWILPNQLQSEHPSGSNPCNAGAFISDILKIFTDNPAVWARTALFITYDENDGFFDHVPPPAPPSYIDGSNVAGQTSPSASTTGSYFSTLSGQADYTDQSPLTSDALRPWGLGPRVPMIVVSPWSRGNWTNSQVFSHASIGMFLEKRFGIRIPNIDAWTRAVCGDLTSAFNFATPNNTAPSTNLKSSGEIMALLASQSTAAIPTTPQNQRLAQEWGPLPACALPYNLNVTSFVWRDILPNPCVRLNFENNGLAGAVLHVYDMLALDKIPKRYTIAAGEAVGANFPVRGAFDFYILGPNGFHRRIKGNTQVLAYPTPVNPDVNVLLQPARNSVIILCQNTGEADCKVRVGRNIYSVDSVEQTFTICPNYSRTIEFPLRSTYGWYDISVTADNAIGFLRRLAGHVETGASSITDPMMYTETPPA